MFGEKMGKQIKVMHEGELTDAEEVHIDQISEHQNTYLLSDGAVLNARLVVISVARLKGRWNQDGQPIYVLKTQAVLDAKALEKYMRPKDGA